jgi:hypothetical protein
MNLDRDQLYLAFTGFRGSLLTPHEHVFCECPADACPALLEGDLLGRCYHCDDIWYLLCMHVGVVVCVDEKADAPILSRGRAMLQRGQGRNARCGAGLRVAVRCCAGGNVESLPLLLKQLDVE